MISSKKIISKTILLTILAFVFSLPFIVKNENVAALITYTKVGEIEEDSNYSPPYIGYAPDATTCFSLVIVCHLEGNGYQTTYKSRSVWQMPRRKSGGSYNFFSINNLNVSSDVLSTDPRSHQKICIQAKDISRSTARDSIDYTITGYDQSGSYEILSQYFGIKISKKGFREYCKNYQIVGSKSSIRITLWVYPANTIIVDKIVLYQGGSGPSVIDEIAAHPFDTGTK